MPYKYPTPEDRIVTGSVLTPLGCWLWIRRAKIGRGGSRRPIITFRKNGRVISMLAYRYSFELFTGKHIKRGQVIAHKCNNSLCVNPDHLRATTQRSNIRQCVKDGRHISGFSAKYRVAGSSDIT